MDDPTTNGEKGPHDVKPYRDPNSGRIYCRTCDGTVVGTPTGWFHVGEMAPTPGRTD